MSGHVDLSGAVAAVLRGYGSVVAAYRRRAAGDPAALRASSRLCLGHADSVAAAGTAVREGSTAPDWTGLAADRYRTAARAAGADLTGVGTMLRRQAGVLDSAAGSLLAAHRALDTLLVDFTARGNVLCANASAVPAGQAGAVLAAARSLGESAARAAAEVDDRLGGELTALAGGLPGYEPTEGR